ncbi:MAG: glycosyltransferase family 2 protein, partial [Candidatus Gastranaerophilaceae bacterium]
MKKISVIVPVYNMEKYLVRCLESIVNQTYPDLEIICVNDGSTDSSAKILETYASKDKRIKLITKENGGLSSARNAGINAATGEFITFVDSDDWIQPDTYNIVSRYMSDADMLIFGTNVVGDFSFVSKEGDEEYYRVKYEGLRKLTDEERLNTDVSAWNKIYRLSIIKDNNIRFAEGFHYEDFAFFWQYSVMCKTVYYVKDKLYNYLRREGSIMAATFKKSSDKVIDHLKMSDVIYDFWINKGLYEEHKSAFKELFLNCFDFSMRYTRKQ